jgi:hypothetical protein
MIWHGLTPRTVREERLCQGLPPTVRRLTPRNVGEERVAQGLPPSVTDRRTLSRLAVLVRQTQARKPRRAA